MSDRHTLGLVYGRRRIGKSTLLEAVSAERDGFYWEATRTEPAIQRSRLGEALGAHLGVGRLAFDTWEDAVRQLVRLGADRSIPVVLDEVGHILEADSSFDSVLASMLGPGELRHHPGSTRLILCGSAIAMLGGVIGYATDMVDHDLPAGPDDFDRWVAGRVLSPAATLHHEATTLLAEDPTLTVSSPVVHHSVLGAIANGSVTAGRIANQLRRSVSNLEPTLKRPHVGAQACESGNAGRIRGSCGPSLLSVRGVERRLDVVVASAEADLDRLYTGS